MDKIPDAGGISDKAFWQTSSSAVVPAECLSHLLDSHGRLVLKAPWSGSGRGLRWLQGRVRDKDKEWIVHILKQQGSVAAEPWEEVMQEFAMEFVLDDDVRFAGFSLFSARGGVYQGNVLLTDRGIEQRLGEYVSSSMIRHIQLLLTYWLRQHVLPYYKGPLGVDMYIHDSPRGPRLRPCSEINFRHTMGLVAHEYLRRHQQEEGKVFAIRYVASTYHYSCC